MKKAVSIAIASLFFVMLLMSCESQHNSTLPDNSSSETTDINIIVDTEPESTEPLEKPINLSSSWIIQTAELSTIKTKIHFSGVGSANKTWLWGAITVGKNQVYFQYDAEFEIGVKIGSVSVDKETRTVNVEMSGPNLINLKIDDSSLDKYPIIVVGSDNIIKSSDIITATEKNSMLATAKEYLEDKIKEERTNFDVALQNAETLIESYVEIISDGTYSVKYIMK